MASTNPIYDVSFSNQASNTAPPNKRKPGILQFFISVVYALQCLHDIFFTIYTDSFGGATWVAGVYTTGQRVRYIDHAVYEVIVATTATVPGTSTDWFRISDVWIGANERIKYNGQKMILEYAVNKWFDTQFRYLPLQSDIYIVNNLIRSNQFIVAINEKYSSFVPIDESLFARNAVPISEIPQDSNAFTIFVPIAVSNALTTETPDAIPNISANRANIINAFVNKYKFAGIQFNLITY